ncbi:hypothetical protein ACIQ62_07400 [Streptomyces sp. NPDC096319]|uniref:hypothetical protein n=1 Tax=Streptomyces sp. NPDC096319 TaxID=3366084 RepID=UPI003816CEFC
MRPAPSRLRRTTTAVALVLAVTAGPAVTAPAAWATPAATAANTQASDPYQLSADTGVRQIGSTGYLTAHQTFDSEANAHYDYVWHRYADGSETPLGEQHAVNSIPSDVVPLGTSGTGIQLKDMSAPPGTPAVVIDLGALGPGHVYAATIGSTLLVDRYATDRTVTPFLVSKTGGSLSKRAVTGLPAGLTDLSLKQALPDGKTILLGYESPAGKGLAVVDMATAAVKETYTPGASTRSFDTPVALSDRYVAWFESNEDMVLVVTDRETGTARRFAYPNEWTDVALVGDWVVTGTAQDLDSVHTRETPLTARPLKGGEPVKLLDRMVRAYGSHELLHGPDGTLYAHGGVSGGRVGLHRVTLGADGAPAVELAYSTGVPTDVALTWLPDPDVRLDALEGGARLSWRLSRGGLTYDVTLTHKESGRQKTFHGTDGGANLSVYWDGRWDATATEPAALARPGTYTWELKAHPEDGVGPDLRETGTYEVTRVHRAHDYNWNGTPDVFARDASGKLWRADSGTTYDLGYRFTAQGAPAYVGWGWDTYDRIESVGDVGGTNVADLVTRDKSGGLWLHQGTGLAEKPFADRVKIGTGWGIYQQLAGGSDLDGDGRPDLVATDKAGGLWAYRGTGGTAPAYTSPPRKIGTGWNIYNQLTATGNIAGGPAGDLLARDKAGVLWLYLGLGNGTFGPRIKVGSGWNAYTDLVALGDGDRDGHNDVYAYGPNGASYFYRGTTRWQAPFDTRRATSLLRTGTTYNQVS